MLTGYGVGGRRDIESTALNSTTNSLASSMYAEDEKMINKVEDINDLSDCCRPFNKFWNLVVQMFLWQKQLRKHVIRNHGGGYEAYNNQNCNQFLHGCVKCVISNCNGIYQ